MHIKFNLQIHVGILDGLSVSTMAGTHKKNNNTQAPVSSRRSCSTPQNFPSLVRSRVEKNLKQNHSWSSCDIMRYEVGYYLDVWRPSLSTYNLVSILLRICETCFPSSPKFHEISLVFNGDHVTNCCTWDTPSISQLSWIQGMEIFPWEFPPWHQFWWHSWENGKDKQNNILPGSFT